jgi:hypothetical protein
MLKNMKLNLSPASSQSISVGRWLLIHEAVFLGVQTLGDINHGKFFKKCPDLSQMEMVSGRETKSQFLVDDADVITGEKAERHDYFVGLLEEAGKTLLSWLQSLAGCGILETIEAIRQKLNEKK